MRPRGIRCGDEVLALRNKEDAERILKDAELMKRIREENKKKR
jgi:hypothetical protein